MRRWIKEVFIIIVNIEYFPHDCRSAGTRKTNNTAVNIDEIIKRGYRKNRQAFFKYYDKNITEFATDNHEFDHICQ